MVCIAVQDHGIGIPLEQRQRVFAAVTTADGREAARAIAAGERLGLEGAVAEALALLALAREPADTAAAPAAIAVSLTTREMEVLRYLVEGLSDREIAEALSISRRTAGGHVANLMAKLGVGSRSAAAVAAVRLSLVPDRPAST